MKPGAYKPGSSLHRLTEVLVVDVAALAALVRVLTAVAAHPVLIRDSPGAARALQRLLRLSVQAHVIRLELDHHGAARQRHGELRRRLRLPRRQLQRRHLAPRRAGRLDAEWLDASSERSIIRWFSCLNESKF